MTVETPPSLNTSRLARSGVVVAVAGLFIILIGFFPEVVQLDLTPGIGILQIFVLLVGVSLVTLGAYVYMYATRHRDQPPRLREDVGTRLMATGLVICYACGFADVLGIGSHFGAERPLFGGIQAWGVAIGCLVIGIGVALYSRR